MEVNILSYNVNGLQSVLKTDPSGFKDTKSKLSTTNTISALLKRENPDVVCLQEIRCSEKFSQRKYFPGFAYHYCNHCTAKKGYSGTMILSKIKPLRVINNFGPDESSDDPGLSQEGRVITLEFEKWYIVNIYSPNSGVDTFHRLNWRCEVWETALRRFLANLISTGKEVIVAGDLNVISTNLDCWASILISGNHPREKSAFRELLSLGFTDTYRSMHPLTKSYTWRYKSNPNKGYRLDYALTTVGVEVRKSEVLENKGSDHVPISITIII